MPKGVLLFLVWLVPAGILGFLADRMARQDHAEGLRALDTRLNDEATMVARRVEDVLSDAATQAAALHETPDPMEAGAGMVPAPRLYLLADGDVSFEPEPGPTAAVAPEEQRLFELSLAGGEHYEFALGWPGRAFDAYTFYLPRIDSAALGDELRYRAARVARRLERAELGEALLEELAAERSAARMAGIPLDVLACHELFVLDPTPERRAGLEAMLLERHGTLSNAALERLAISLTGSERLADLVRARRSIADGVRAVAEALRQQTHVVHDGALYVRRARAVVRVPVELPRGDSAEYPSRFVASSDAPATTVGVVPVRLESGPGADTILGHVHVTDSSRPERVARLDRERALFRLQIALLFLLLAGAGAAFLLAVARERRLARLRVKLLANVSHELRTPITSIRMFSEMMTEDSLDDAEQRQFGEHLLAESLRLSHIVDDLLDYARERDRVLAQEPVDVAGLLEHLVESFAYRARDAGVELRVTVERGGSSILETNRDAVERIVSNLLDNALKYRSDREPWIELEATFDRGARIRVRDNGIGVARRDQQRVFEEFYRARYENYVVQGTGLGLAISRSLAGKLGGRLLLESRPGEGSTFTLELPGETPARDDDRDGRRTA